MSLHLDGRDVRRLDAAIRTLLSPLDYPDPDAWRLEAMRSVRDLVGADVACFCLALEGRDLFLTEPEHRAAVRAFEERYAPLDGGAEARRRELGLEVAHLSMLVDMPALRRTEFWNDFVVPFRLYDTAMLLTDVGPGGSPAGFVFHHDEPSPRAPFGERELALLRLLVPAVEAGVAACLEGRRGRESLVRTVDAAPAALLLADARGRTVHRNPALLRLLECDPLPEKLLWAGRFTARGLARLLDGGGGSDGDGEWPEACRTVRTPGGAYRVRGTLLGPGSGGEGLVLVTFETRGDAAPEPRRLRDRFALSRRQAEVALLLAARKTNREIADELGISPHTARRHTEQVLRRLGIASRRQVGPRIRRA